MYLRKIALRNVGPTIAVDINPRFTEGGLPVPIVIVGQNGAGKSLVLSSLLDAFVEAKKQGFREIAESATNQYVRTSSKTYIRAGAEYSIVEIDCADGDTGFSFTECLLAEDRATFMNKHPDFLWMGKNVANLGVEDNGFGHVLTPRGNLTEAVRKNLFLYFPYFRYESPAWLNRETPIGFAFKEGFLGINKESMVQVDVVDKFASWLLDVILDREIYEISPAVPASIQIGNAPAFRSFWRSLPSGPNTTTVNLLQQVLLAIFKAKDPSITNARFGISKKTHRSISVHVTRGNDESIVAPRIQQLSSGELMILSMFASLLRTHDSLTGSPAMRLEEITGVVFIDEIDLHLHINLQKTVLPSIINLFPKVQFVITTHSPFFLLGLSETSERDIDIYDFPTGVKIKAEEFSEFEEGYSVFIEKNEQFLRGFQNISRQLTASQRPLIVTEGKTDWKHLKAALLRLKANGRYTELDVDFLEYGDDVDMGDSRLSEMCEYYAHVAQPRKVLFIFDRDAPKIVAKMGGDQALGYKSWSPTVFSLCIPVPPHRRDYTNISIEFFYSDDEIRTPHPESGTRLFFSNEVELYRSPGQSERVRVLPAAVVEDERSKKIFDQDCSRIINAEGQRVAHSKSVFADQVLESRPGFQNFDLAGFVGLFDVVSRVVAA